MFVVPYEKMICDSDRGDGNISFYDEYCEWLNRDTGNGFKIFYRDIDDVKVMYGIKKTVVVVLKSGERINLYLYRGDTLRQLLYEAVQRVNGNVVQDAVVEVPREEEDDISKLERLAKLHESGALTDEEFAEAKKKILKM